MEFSDLVLFLYLSTLGFYLIFETVLILLNSRSAQAGLEKLPAELQGIYEIETYKKSVLYARAKSFIAIISLLYQGFLAAIFALYGWYGSIENYTKNISNYNYLNACFFVFAVSLIFGILNLPIAYYKIFHLEERFGFNKTTVILWLADMCKGLVLGFIIITPLLLALFYCIDQTGKNWWIYAFVVMQIFQVLILFIFPVLIAPLFNKFEPLAEGKLKDDLVCLAEKCKFKANGLFTMDGSKRSAHANAYFTGFGRNKRIVLFDTLIEKLSSDEITAVLAHEIGHAKKGHVLKGLFLSGVNTLLSFYLLSLLLQSTDFFKAFGFEVPSPAALLVLGSVAFEPVIYFISPLFSFISRKHEFQADKYASEVLGSGKSLVSGLIKLSKESLSNLNPHPVYSFMHYSHPSLGERIRALSLIK